MGVAAQLGITIRKHEQRARNRVLPSGHSIRRGENAIDLQCLDCFVHKTKSGVSDGRGRALYPHADGAIAANSAAKYVEKQKI